MNKVNAIEVVNIIRRLKEMEKQLGPDCVLAQFEEVAAYCVGRIGAIARAGECDRLNIARSLDQIDFTLGQAFGELHKE